MITHEIPHIFCVRTRWNCQNFSILTILKSRSKSAQNYDAGLMMKTTLIYGEWGNDNKMIVTINTIVYTILLKILVGNLRIP